jgi:hypothetical protein
VLARGGLIAEVGGALGKGSAMNATRGAKTATRSRVVTQTAANREEYRLNCLYNSRITLQTLIVDSATCKVCLHAGKRLRQVLCLVVAAE